MSGYLSAEPWFADMAPGGGVMVEEGVRWGAGLERTEPKGWKVEWDRGVRVRVIGEGGFML